MIRLSSSPATKTRPASIWRRAKRDNRHSPANLSLRSEASCPQPSRRARQLSPGGQSAASIFRRALFVMVCSAPSNNGAAALPIKHPVPKTGSASDRHTAVDYAHVLKTSPMPASRPPRSLFSSKTTSASTAKPHSARPFGRKSQAVGRAVRMALPAKTQQLAQSGGVGTRRRPVVPVSLPPHPR